MTVRDFVRLTKQRFRRQSPPTALKQTAKAAARGVVRRVNHLPRRSIWARDWDVLVVLDACRVDLWREVVPEYDVARGTAVWSNAACSIDWIERNLAAHPEQCERLGTVTGNPFTNHDVDNCVSADLGYDDFAYFEPLYRSEWQEVRDGIATIPPQPLTDHAIDAWRHRDDLGVDQLIVHYMQPHQPYRSRPDWGAVGNNLRNLQSGDDAPKPGACAWQQARKGKINTDELWAAYRENLRWVLDDVCERLLPNLEGTVVLTSDHGNAMGEFGEWGHPPGALAPQVWRVPWASIECTDEETVNLSVKRGADGQASTDQLEALGYV